MRKLAISRTETFSIAEEHLERALTLNPDLGEAYITRAYLGFFRDRDAEGAMSAIDQAIKILPDNALAWQTKGMIASASGNAAVSLDAIERAHALDPLFCEHNVG